MSETNIQNNGFYKLHEKIRKETNTFELVGLITAFISKIPHYESRLGVEEVTKGIFDIISKDVRSRVLELLELCDLPRNGFIFINKYRSLLLGSLPQSSAFGSLNSHDSDLKNQWLKAKERRMAIEKGFYELRKELDEAIELEDRAKCKYNAEIERLDEVTVTLKMVQLK